MEQTESAKPEGSYFRDFQLPILLELYSNPQSDLYMERSTKVLTEAANKDARLYGISREAILQFKMYVEELSRAKTLRVLKPWERRYSYRRYRSFAPRDIITGDIAFLDNLDLKVANNGKHILLLLMDVFSRFISLQLQANAKAETTLKSFQIAIKNDFYANPDLTPNTMNREEMALRGDAVYRKFLSDKGSEFKAGFLSTLKIHYRIDSYSTNLGRFPKVAIVERAVRTIKALFFRFTLKYRTLKVDNIIQLIQRQYNFRPHGGLYGFSPFQVHFDPSASARVLLKNEIVFTKHQKIAKSIFEAKPYFQKLKVGDRVFLRAAPNPFEKEAGLIRQAYSSESYTIIAIDKLKFPYLHTLRGIEPMHGARGVSRRFYAHELVKIKKLPSPSTPAMATQTTPSSEATTAASNQTKQFHPTELIDARYSKGTSKFLRSGREVMSQPEIEYLVRKRDNSASQTQWLLKNNLKGKYFTHGKKFELPEYQKFLYN
jgi:hypothetical protein